MDGFVNRNDELSALRERLRSDRAEYFVVYGRRRVGKSELLLHFGRDHRQFYFEATAGSRADHLEDIATELARFTGNRIYVESPLTNWRAVFTAFDSLLAEGELVLVLDEFQYMARREPELGSLLNRFIRRHQDNGDLLLCIAGSDLTFFLESVVGYGATTYGRRTASLNLRPLDFTEIGAFTPGWDPDARIATWAIFGGIPYYLREIDAEASLMDTVRRSVLYPEGLLRNEPRFLLAQEGRIREVDTYMACLRAIATGANRLNEIAQRLGFNRAEEARHPLSLLEEMELIRRVRPIVSPRGKKVRYEVADPFLRFWYRFIAPYESRLHSRHGADRHLEQVIAPELDAYIAQHAFEEVCREWLFGQVPDAVEVGSWWGSIRQREQGALVSRRYEADVALTGANGTLLALGSCKWPAAANTDHRHDAAELDKLERIRNELKAPQAHLWFFDRYGFSSRLEELAAERDDISLVLADDVVT